MFNLFKSKKQKQVDLIYEIMDAWHSGCIADVDNMELLKEPRVIVGTILFFIGSMDNLCQSVNFDDKKFMMLAIDILEKLGYSNEVSGPVFMNFYNPRKKQSAFALKANTEGGRGIGVFLEKRDSEAWLIFSDLVDVWAKNPDMTGEDLYLFDWELKNDINNNERENTDSLDYEDGEVDDLYEDAKRIALESSNITTAFLQREFKIGYARALRLLNILKKDGLVNTDDSENTREKWISNE